MILKGKAEEVAQEIIDLFEQGTLPEPLATLYIRMGQHRHASTWSLPNQLLVAKRRYRDARTFKQWKQAGRSVTKGQKAFQIFAPITRRFHQPESDKADDNGNVTICLGYRTLPVFGYEQTDGEPIPELHAEEHFLDELPLLEVARAWGLEVGIFQAAPGGALGYFVAGEGIHLGVKNWRAWAHELLHAADHRCRGSLKGDSKLEREVVADLGGATLLRCLGYEDQADLGRVFDYIRSYAEREQIPVIQACTTYLGRIAAAVELVLKTATELRKEVAA
jgi:antirestriction protein ArdC